MKKVSVIYWSNGGNVESIANAIAEGASKNDVMVETKHVVDSSIGDILESDAVALGSPAMINDDIEQMDMKPFVNSLKDLDIHKKPLVLFGSCGWREEKFIHKWENNMKEYGFNVVGKLVVKDSLNNEQLQNAKKLGKSLIEN